MKEIRHFFLMFFLTGMVHISYASFGTDQDTLTFFGKIAKEESSIPIRPGKPGEVPFWNTYTKRFIYAPAFNYPTVKGADRYRFEILCKADSTVYSFESEVPYTPLTPVWAQMPIGHFDIQVIGITKHGDNVGIAGKGSYYRAAYFNGPYHQPVLSYDSSGLVGLYHIMHLSYVNYWLEHKVPDPEYKLYRYPAKMFGSLISGAVMYAKLTPDK